MDNDVQAGLSIMLGGLVGILFAALELSLYNDGIFIDEFITGSLTIADLMAVTIILFTIIGVIVAVLRS